MALFLVEAATAAASTGWTVRDVCHLLVNRLPESAIPGLFTWLGETIEFYSSISAPALGSPLVSGPLPALRGATEEAPRITLGGEE
jgi:hypothetical protein